MQKIKSIGGIIFELRVRTNKQTKMHYPLRAMVVTVVGNTGPVDFIFQQLLKPDAIQLHLATGKDFACIISMFLTNNNYHHYD